MTIEAVLAAYAPETSARALLHLTKTWIARARREMLAPSDDEEKSAKLLEFLAALRRVDQVAARVVVPWDRRDALAVFAALTHIDAEALDAATAAIDAQERKALDDGERFLASLSDGKRPGLKPTTVHTGIRGVALGRHVDVCKDLRGLPWPAVQPARAEADGQFCTMIQPHQPDPPDETHEDP